MTSTPPTTVARAASLLEKQPVAWRRPSGGYTPADRYVIDFSDGSSCFAKAATTPLTATFVRDEYTKVYSKLEAPFLPRLLAWEDDEMPLLVIEDLSHATWPPPWDEARVQAVLQTMKAVAAIKLDGVPPVADVHDPDNWRSLQQNPAPFLSLGLASTAWLNKALPALIEASESAPREGDDLLHCDVRSDNICFDGSRVVLVDWNNTARGNADVDISAWLPSLHSEGGPEPEAILPLAPEHAAHAAGYFAFRAGLPPIPNAPRVRQVQLSQLRSALPWAQRALGLPPLDGPGV
jgi:thiamine kinase-like enzyme